MKQPLISRYLSDDGTVTGNKNANGNYAGAVEEFYIEPAAGESYTLTRMIVSFEDAGGMQAQEYGNIGSALTNGIEVKVVNEDDTVIMDLTDGVPVKTNSQWARLCYDVDVKSWGSGNDLCVVRWTFTKSGDAIYLEEGQRLVVYLNDSLVGLISHYFLVQGTA